MTSELVSEIDGLVLENLIQGTAGAVPVHWCEMNSEPSANLSPAVARFADRATEFDSPICFHNVTGPDFWSTVEITIAAELVDKTIDILR